MAEFLREPMGVVGRELRVGLVLNSSELRLSEPSLKPLLIELLSSQLKSKMTEMVVLVMCIQQAASAFKGDIQWSRIHLPQNVMS